MKYNPYQISADSSAEDIAILLLAIHDYLGLPVTMKSLNKNGVQIEKGKILDNNIQVSTRGGFERK